MDAPLEITMKMSQRVAVWSMRIIGGLMILYAGMSHNNKTDLANIQLTIMFGFGLVIFFGSFFLVAIGDHHEERHTAPERAAVDH